MVSPPPIEGLASVPAHVLESVFTDALCQRDKARGEDGLLAKPGSLAADVAGAREALWRATNRGLAGLIDWMGGTR